MSTPDTVIEMATAGNDAIIGIKPPVDNAFREQIYDVLDGLGLIKELVVRGGAFFEPKSSPDGSPYSELRVASTALSVAGVNLVDIAHHCKDALKAQDRDAHVSPFLKSGNDKRQLFDDPR